MNKMFCRAIIGTIILSLQVMLKGYCMEKKQLDELHIHTNQTPERNNMLGNYANTNIFIL